MGLKPQLCIIIRCSLNLFMRSMLKEVPAIKKENNQWAINISKSSVNFCNIRKLWEAFWFSKNTLLEVQAIKHQKSNGEHYNIQQLQPLRLRLIASWGNVRVKYFPSRVLTAILYSGEK